MQGLIGQVVEPRPVDAAVVGVFSLQQHEGGVQMAVFFAYIAPSQGDILPNDLRGGVDVAPLGGIAVGGHEGLRPMVNFHHPLQIGFGGQTYLHQRESSFSVLLENAPYSAMPYRRQVFSVAVCAISSGGLFRSSASFPATYCT